MTPKHPWPQSQPAPRPEPWQLRRDPDYCPWSKHQTHCFDDKRGTALYCRFCGRTFDECYPAPEAS